MNLRGRAHAQASTQAHKHIHIQRERERPPVKIGIKRDCVHTYVYTVYSSINRDAVYAYLHRCSLAVSVLRYIKRLYLYIKRLYLYIHTGVYCHIDTQAHILREGTRAYRHEGTQTNMRICVYVDRGHM